MTPMVILVLWIRALAIGQVLLVALVIARGQAPRRIRLATAALLLCTCCYLTLQTPMVGLIPRPIWPLIPLGAQSVPLMLWVFAHMLFERRVDWRVAAAGAVITLTCWITLAYGNGDIANRASYAFVAATVQQLAQLALLGHAMLIAFAERGDDLIEKRRRLRGRFVAAVAVLSVMVIMFDAVFGFRGMPPAALLVQALAVLVVTFALGAALLQSDADLLFDPARPRVEGRFSPSEHVLNQKLSTAMAAGGYREMGLTIGRLADKLGVPEHRLRALINQRLGYRNFSSFLNAHRIAEAKALLADPAHVDLPILSIAMDLGYGSLAPFNRAFREAEARAPSEFRRAAILAPGADPAATPALKSTAA